MQDVDDVFVEEAAAVTEDVEDDGALVETQVSHQLQQLRGRRRQQLRLRDQHLRRTRVLDRDAAAIQGIFSSRWILPWFPLNEHASALNVIDHCH